MEQTKGSASKLLHYSLLETKDELDEKLSRCYTALCGMIGGCSDREANDAMIAHVAKGNNQYEDVQLGLLATILIEPKSAARGHRDMNLINRDGLNIVLTRVNQLIFEKWLKLLDSCRSQIVWFCKELVKNSVTGTESIVSNLLRQISGGDVSHKNIWLTENILDMLSENRGWLEKFPALLSTALYTYLRVIVDHGSPSVAVLRQKEVDFCSLLLREKFSDCMLIGRDLVRLMQYVARIPEFEKIWRDMLLNPSALCSQFTGVAQLLQIRTSRKYFISRLTPDMENKLVFLTTKVKFGQHKRYQEWFQRQYLATAESQSLRCDLIRYICAVFHPSNELLCSEIIPRWAVIGWMLTTCTSNVAASNAKLSLFYDWLFFDPERDSIMNIEPAILVMYHSMRPHPAITATLLDFMCRIMPNFCPALSPQIRQGIFTSLRSILDKRVLPSLSPLFDNSKLDKELRGLIKETFTEFCSAEVVKEDPLANSKDMLDIDNGIHIDNNSLSEGVFSDEEDDVPLGKLNPHDMTFKPIKEHQKYEPVEITDSIAQLPVQLKTFVLQLQNEVDQEVQCDLMDRLMQAVIQEDDLDQDIATPLASCLCEVLISQFNNNLFPQELDIDMIEDSIGTPLFVMFRNLCQTPEEDPSRQPLLMLIGEMYLKQPRIGYHLLYFLKVSKVHDERMSTYKDFCKSLDSRDVESCLMSDLKLCQEDDVRLFTYLMPEMYTKFPNIAIGNSELLNMIVSCIDGSQLQDLVCEILQGHLIMFRKDSFLSVLNASLEWETLEQYFLWQLISAHNIPVEHIMPILPKLEFTSHSEALTCVMVLLKQESPSGDLIRPLLCRECKKNDMFTVSVLKYWAQEYEDRLAELIYAQLNKINGTPKKRQRSASSSSRSKDANPSIDQILAHLDHMRQVCRNVSFLNHESVQHTLQTVQMIASEVQKTKYSDLLALAEDFDDFKTVRVLRGRKTSSAMISPKSARSKKPIEDSDSYSDSSEEEEMKPKAKKRKKVTSAIIDDDSD